MGLISRCNVKIAKRGIWDFDDERRTTERDRESN